MYIIVQCQARIWENTRKHISETERGKKSEKAKNKSEKQKERKWEKGVGKRKKK